MIELPGQPWFWGAVGTRGTLPTQVLTDSNPYMWQFGFYMRARTRALRVAIPNWYVDIGSGVETNAGSGGTIELSLEYPIGTEHQFTFNRSTTIASADGATVWTDALPVYVPFGALARLRCRRSGHTALVYNDNPLRSTAIGDQLEQTATNKVMTGTITDNTFGVLMGPAAIIGYTCDPSLGIAGDSRQVGLTEATADASGDCGELSRAFGWALPYINMAVSGETGSSFAANSVKRRAILKYCTAIALCHGANDLGTAAAYEAQLLANAALFRPKRVFATTISPGVGGSERTPFNQWLRAGQNGIAGVFDVTAQMVTVPPDGTTWKGGYVDGDGVHETSTGNSALVRAFPAGMLHLAGAANHMPRIFVP